MDTKRRIRSHANADHKPCTCAVLPAHSSRGRPAVRLLRCTHDACMVYCMDALFGAAVVVASLCFAVVSFQLKVRQRARSPRDALELAADASVALDTVSD